MAGSRLFASIVSSCAVIALAGCADPEDARWRVHPCPPDAAGEEPPGVVVLDGGFGDWSEDDVVATDPVGDASGAFDIIGVSATNRGTDLFVAFEVDRALNLYNGDTDDGTLLLELRLPDGRRMKVDFRARSATLGSGAVVSWRELGLVAAPSHGSSRFEVKLDMRAFGADIGQLVEVDFSGSDALAEPAIVALRYGDQPAPASDEARVPGTDLRVASLNTQEAGLFHSSRQNSIARLLRVASADVYAFQELGFTTGDAVAEQLTALDPRGDGATWYAHADGAGAILGNAVAATVPLIPIPLNTKRAVGAVVLHEEGPVVVLSVHLKCCGYQGSAEDHERMDQVRHLTQKVTELRMRRLGEDLAPYAQAPIVLMGDFNHVGSGELINDLVSPRSLGLTHTALPHLGAHKVFTWVGYESAFPPATLDLLLHHGLEQLGGFVLESDQLPRERLEQLGLWGGDSRASDHLLLVSDFAL